MPLDHDATVGQRIAYYRRRRGLTQAVLAGLVGRSEEWLSQIERGARSVERLPVIVEVAQALRLEPNVLLPPPFHATPRIITATSGIASGAGERSSVVGTAPDSVPEIRRALMRTPGTRTTTNAPPPDPASLRARITWAFECSQTERWSDLAPAIPALLTDTHAAVDTAVDDEARTHALGSLSLAYRVTSGMLDRIGEPHLPWIAAERAAVAAEASGEPLLVGGAAWRWAVVLRHAGEIDASLQVPAEAATHLVPDVDREDDPRRLGVYGALLLKAAVAAASLDDRRLVEEYLALADTAAAKTGDDNAFWFAFGPTNLDIHRVWLATELGDPARALDDALRVDTARLPAHLAERRTSHLITVAWAHYLRRQDDEAIAALVEARLHAPEQLLFTRRVRDMVTTMLTRDRRSRRPLRALAEFLDLA